MKILLISLLAILFFASCAHKQNKIEFDVPVTRLPSSEEAVNLRQYSTSELYQLAGKNTLLVVGNCSASSWAIVAAGLGETIPMLSYLTTIATDLKINGPEFPKADSAFHARKSKTVVSTIGGSAVSMVADLSKASYDLLFKSDSMVPAEQFKHTKSGYAATAALAKHFYSQEGSCGKAGRNLNSIVSEINSRH